VCFVLGFGAAPGAAAGGSRLSSLQSFALAAAHAKEGKESKDKKDGEDEDEDEDDDEDEEEEEEEEDDVPEPSEEEMKELTKAPVACIRSALRSMVFCVLQNSCTVDLCATTPLHAALFSWRVDAHLLGGFSCWWTDHILTCLSRIFILMT
jgi:uncharacterized membrane protein YdbT with pleckstrin-like domain